VALAWSQSSLSSVTPTMLMFTIIGIGIAGFGLQLTLFRKDGSKKKSSN